LKTRTIDRYRSLRLEHAAPTEEPTWYVLFTAAGKEKAVAEDLEAFGFAAFCPMEAVWRLKPLQQRRKGTPHRVKHERPLLSRYVFVGMDPHRGPWRTVKLIEGVRDVLRADGRFWPVPAPAIAKMREAYEAGFFDQTVSEAARLAEMIGQIVTINRGPFAGFLATVTAASAKYVSAEIDMLGRKATVKMHREDVET
jgi:transcription antitermination factor NusG